MLYRSYPPPFHLNFFNLHSLQHTLGRAGFRVVAQKTKIASWRGIQGPKFKCYLRLPYLVGNGLIGRLRGNILILLAQVVLINPHRETFPAASHHAHQDITSIAISDAPNMLQTSQLCDSLRRSEIYI